MTIPNLSQIIMGIESDNPSVIENDTNTKLTQEQEKKLEVYVRSCENTKAAFFSGIQGVSKLIWSASQNNELSKTAGFDVATVDESDLANVAWLLSEVGQVLESMDYLESSTQYQLNQNRILKERNNKI